MNVAFRFDCDPEIGMGHAIRCLAIANELQQMNVECMIFHQESSTNYLPTQVSENIKCIALPNSQELYACVHSSHMPLPDALIVDHYGEARKNLSASTFKETTKILIDDFDTQTNFPCEILINPNIGSKQNKGASQLHLLGPAYAPIRKEIRKLARSWQPAISSEALFHCLISIGATDPFNLTSRILRSVQDVYEKSTFHFVVILASSAPHLNEVKKLCIELEKEINVEVITDAENMGELYKKAHCCIGAAGSSAWERCCVGLPTAQLVVADNQQHIQDELVREKAVIDLPHPDDDAFFDRLSAFLDSAITQSEEFLALSQQGQRIVDGHGAKRIADAIVKELAA